MILEVKKLAKSYGGQKIVYDISFEVAKGEVVGLLGPNGAGKTTAFYMTIGLVRPDEGTVLFCGQDVSFLPMYKRAQMGMGYLAQEPSIFRGMSVEENILSILETRPLSRKKRKEQLEELLAELHLTPLRKKKGGSLSGGERRRLEVTRALATNPSFLLLDEPFANIDPLSISDLKEIIRHLAQKGISILITDHNAREIFDVVSRSYLVDKGRVLLGGTPSELIASEEARRHYFGTQFKL
ncbi:MAG: LPS export ABC transporter ATP-binding protein [Verrucomicrobia bacterium]|nr:LPS export ABC transporter ATP-binding protein [Verrucomicrobiota bacterium]